MARDLSKWDPINMRINLGDTAQIKSIWLGRLKRPDAAPSGSPRRRCVWDKLDRSKQAKQVVQLV